MRVLVGLGSCIAYENNGYDDALRKTCLRQAHIKGVDYKVFIGDRLAITHNISPQAWINFSPPHLMPHFPNEDTVVLPCDDGYFGAMWKTREMFKWFLETKYDFLFHCDHDTYFSIDRLLSSGFENYEVAGLFGEHSVFAGPGYFVSRKACKIYVDEIKDAVKGHRIGEANFYCSYLPDLWLGILVKDHGLKMGTSSSFIHMTSREQEGPRKSNTVTSCHLSTFRPGGYSPELLLSLHAEWNNSWGTEEPNNHNSSKFTTVGYEGDLVLSPTQHVPVPVPPVAAPIPRRANAPVRPLTRR